MIEASAMLGRRTCGDSSGFLYFPVSPAGILRCSLPDGQQGDLFGQSPAPASRSQRPAKAKVGPTIDISGLSSSGSSASASLSASCLNRLKARLDTDGLIEFSMTWKEKVSPAGRSFSLLRASGRHTSEAVSSAWRSPDTGENRWGAYRDPGKALRRAEAGHQINLEDQAILTTSGWASPSARDYKDTPGMATSGVNPDGSVRDRTDQLPRQAQLSGWSSPRANKWGFPDAHGSQEQPIGSWQTPKAEEKVRSAEFLEGRSPNPMEVFGWTSPTAVDGRRGSLPPRPHDTGVPLSQMAALSGLTSISSPVQTANRGALSPVHSLWLMGYPLTWLFSAIRSFSRKEPRS